MVDRMVGAVVLQVRSVMMGRTNQLKFSESSQAAVDIFECVLVVAAKVHDIQKVSQ